MHSCSLILRPHIRDEPQPVQALRLACILLGHGLQAFPTRSGSGFEIPCCLCFRSVSCKTCGDKSVRSRAEYCFCVTCPVDAGGRHRKIDVKDLLMTYTQEEHINEWKCDKCFHPGCVRQAGIAHPPNILMVHISRPQQGWTSQVTFERELAIQCDAASYRKMRYLIYAVIVYRSMGTNGGHYFAFVRSGRGQSEQWYLADDDEIRSVSWAEVQREEPFMLLYEARKVIPPIATDSVALLQRDVLLGPRCCQCPLCMQIRGVFPCMGNSLRTPDKHGR